LILNICFAKAQNFDNVWLFGYDSYGTATEWGGTVIDFNTIPPTLSFLFNEMNFLQANASVCDSSGSLQFYTNGLYIANKNHEPMANGGGLNPGDFADNMLNYGYILDQGAFIVPFPDSSNHYYLFHADKQYPTPQVDWNSKYLYYTEIDMGLANGLGEVVAKNQVILDDTLGVGKLNAVRHANGRDWWMMVYEMASKNYYRILVSKNGIANLGSGQTSYSIPEEGVGQVVFSPDGSLFARMNTVNFNAGQYIDIYNFDRCNGYITGIEQIRYDDDALMGGVAISPNSRYLYVPSFNRLYQFDLQAADIPASKKTIYYDGFMEASTGFTTQFYLAQLAPDGKIYICTANGTHYLHVIHQPNLPYPDCMVEQHGITLPTYNAFSMPNFPNYRLGPLDGSPCDTLGLDNNPIAKFRYDQDTTDYLSVRFTDLSYYEPGEWSWAFGDGTVSQDTSPYHTFPSDGTYEVCLTVSNQYSSNTFCQVLVIGTGISAIDEESPEGLVNVFPNPAKEATNIILSGYLPRHALLNLYTATGQSVLQQRINFGWNLVQLESVSPGMYFWELKDACLPGQGMKLLGNGKLIVME
jgi:PKD domain